MNMVSKQITLTYKNALLYSASTIVVCLPDYTVGFSFFGRGYNNDIYRINKATIITKSARFEHGENNE